MKKAHWICYATALGFCLAGILLRERLNVLDIVLVCLGVALFLLGFLLHSTSKAQRCPNCNAVIYRGHIRTVLRQKDGLFPCERCTALVCVDYSHRK